jgi:Zinc carboxypeptidase
LKICKGIILVSCTITAHKSNFILSHSLINEEEIAIAKRLKRKNMPGVPTMDWVNYYDFDETMAWIDEMQTIYPQWINVTTIGHSAQGRPIRLMTLSKRPVSNVKDDIKFEKKKKFSE